MSRSPAGKVKWSDLGMDPRLEVCQRSAGEGKEPEKKKMGGTSIRY